MENNPAHLQQAPAYQPPHRDVYEKPDGFFGIAAFLIGHLFFNWVLFGGLGLGACLFTVFACVFALLYMRKKGVKPTPASYIYLGLILTLGSSYFIFSNFELKLLTTLLLMAIFCYWVYVACSNRQAGKINDMLFFDMLKSAVVMPFSAFGAAFGAIKNTSSTGERKRGLNLLFVVVGIIIAIIPTLIVITMLQQADSAFNTLIEKILLDLIEVPFDILRHPLFLVLGIPVSLYVFGLLYANATHKNAETLTERGSRSFLSALRFLPGALVYAAITPLCIVYLLFFISQSAYFLSSFKSLIPDGITYAEYARRGFFELCGVAVLNAGAQGLMALLTRRSGEKKATATTVYTVILSVFTLALIAVALSKMFMYIGVYGLTLRRVYTSWFMALLAFFFILILIKQLAPKLKLMRTAAVGFIIMFLGLVFCDVDAQIARYNVNGYLSGRFEDVDIQMMYELSDSAVPYVLALEDDENWLVERNAERYLQSRADLLGSWKLRQTNLTVQRAKGLLDKAGYEAREEPYIEDSF